MLVSLVGYITYWIISILDQPLELVWSAENVKGYALLTIYVILT